MRIEAVFSWDKIHNLYYKPIQTKLTVLNVEELK